MTTTEALRKQVEKYIDKADENSLRRVNAILGIDQQDVGIYYPSMSKMMLMKPYYNPRGEREKLMMR